MPEDTRQAIARLLMDYPQQSNSLLGDVFTQLVSNQWPLAPPTPAAIPLPRPDPRWQAQRQMPSIPSELPNTSWAQGLPRARESQDPGSQTQFNVIPPSLFLNQMMGITPSRKHGDAIDFDPNNWAPPARFRFPEDI